MTDKASIMEGMMHKTTHVQLMRNAHKPYFKRHIAYDLPMSAPWL